MISRAATMPNSKLPKYRKPPVSEVLCGLYFQDLVSLHAPHLGEFWRTIRSDYPGTETMPLLPPVSSGNAQGFFLQLAESGELPRTWFIKQDGKSLIQVQRDRLIFNWRQQRSEDCYPSFEKVFAEFKEIVSKFSGFILSEKLGAFKVTGCELGYINTIPYGPYVESPQDVCRLFPFLAIPTSRSPALSSISALNFNAQFDLPNECGNLQMLVQTAHRRIDGEPVIRFDLVARKLGLDIALESMSTWFEAAHDAIVSTFADVTCQEVQQSVWEREQ